MVAKAGIIGIVLSLMGSFSAMAQTAGCQDRMTALRGDRYAFQQITKASYSAAGKALDHFRAEAQTEGYIRQYVAYYRIETGTVTGFRYTVVAKDRSLNTEITYYLDVNKKLVYAKKTAPEQAYWFCQ